MVDNRYKNNKKHSNDNEDNNPAAIQKLMNFCDEIQMLLFIDDQSGDSFAKVEDGNKAQLFKIQSSDFRKKILYEYYQKHRIVPSNETLQQLSDLLEYKTCQTNQIKSIYRRIGNTTQDVIYYHLANNQHSVAKISSTGYKLLHTKRVDFYQSKNTKPQVIPSKGGCKSHVLKHFRFKQEADQLLFLVYLVTCLISSIPHPILMLAGDKGAAKSTTLRMLKAIVDPSQTDLLQIPKHLENLIINLGNNYMCCFDNLAHLNDEQSNLLCMASTGGTITKRKLYSDSEEVFIYIKRCIALNGINLAGLKPDLLDRSIVIELDRVPKEERKTESDIWAKFYQDLPYILDWCFTTLSKAIEILPTISLTTLPRMADFAKWGEAVSQAIGHEANAFLTAYQDNQKRQNEDIITFDTVAHLTTLFMQNKESWHGSWTDLYAQYENTAKTNQINLNHKDWPRGINLFSRRLNEVRTDLEQFGIHYTVTRGKTKTVNLSNSNFTSKRRKRATNS